MQEWLERLTLQFGISTNELIVIGIGLGMLMVFWSLVSMYRDRNPAAERMAQVISHREKRADFGILKAADTDPSGFLKSFMPGEVEKRTALRIKLEQAGFSRPTALRNYLLVRVVLGIGGPTLFLLLYQISTIPAFSFPVLAGLSELSRSAVFQLLGLFVATGYYLPVLWLSSRITERQQRITESFPNALDLMQISLEAGLGFDAAMTRVGNELTHSSPDIAYEFLTVQRQIAAGRDRGSAMRGMAERTGVEMVHAFANVVQQSMQFGTSMAQALTTYADEMRTYRETKAEEMANKLPVKMSAVLAAFIMPALLLMILGPIMIRFVRSFAAVG